MANKASMPNGMPQTKWKITTDDNSTGSVMDTARPEGKNRGTNKTIGPVSKTKFGQNRKAI